MYIYLQQFTKRFFIFGKYEFKAYQDLDQGNIVQQYKFERVFYSQLLKYILFEMSKGTTLGDEQTLNAGQYIQSRNGYYAVMQQDGNFVLYQTMVWVPENAIWASNSDGRGVEPRRIVMQNDGNLVIYDTYNNPTWASNTNNVGTQPHKLVMQDDRNLVIYDGNDQPTWATNTKI